jgi:RND family efflux transporter MFP subunit
LRILERKSAATLAASTFAFLGLVVGCERGNTYAPPPPPEVTVSHPIRKEVTTYLEYTGTTKAYESVEIRARVKGFLKERHFVDGSDVKAGQLLLVIDEEPYKVKLDVANAKLAEAKAALQKAEQSKMREVARAQMALDQALFLLAKIDESRQRSLLNRGASSKEDFDKAEANRKKYEAQVQADAANLEQAEADYQANILSARANVEMATAEVRNAEIELGYCRMVSPIDGRISRGLVDVGNYVGDGQPTLLATVVKTDPIYAYMTVSEADLLRFRRQVREGKRVDYRKEIVPLELGLASEEGFPHKGRVEYTDPGVDPVSGTLLARGVFPNPGNDLVPGLFVRIRVALEKRPDALLVPERALGMDQTGHYVLVVDKQNVVSQRTVKVGATEGRLRVIEDNLKPDDLVVVNGLQRARPGLKVKPKLVEPASSVVTTSPLGSSNLAGSSPLRQDERAATIAGTFPPLLPTSLP